MRFCPSCPLELPSTAPPGAGERRQRRADSIGLAASMKAPAITLCRLPAPSMYSTALTCPPSFTSRQASALKRSWQRRGKGAAPGGGTPGGPFGVFRGARPPARPPAPHGGRPPEKAELVAPGGGVGGGW